MARPSKGPWYRQLKNAWFVTVGGRQIGLGVRERGNERKAVKAWHRLMAQEPPGADQEPPKANRPVVRVRALIDEFLGDVETRAKPHTVETYRYFLGVFSAGFGERDAETVKPYELEGAGRKPTWNPTTRADFLGAVVSAFRWATRAGLLPVNPLTNVRKPRRLSRGAKVVVSEDVHRKVLAAANPALADVLTLLWETGCRPSEVFRLTARDVDFRKDIAVLHEHKTDHTGRPRLIVLTRLPGHSSATGRPIPGRAVGPQAPR